MHRWMLLLALAAALLMALAPVVSRGMQAVQGAHASMAHAMPAMAMAGGTQALPPAMDAHAGHADAVGSTGKTPAPDPHAAHGEACDYCTMASRLLQAFGWQTLNLLLLPWLAVLLLLAPLLYRIAPQPARASLFSAGLRWPAHPARGPPLFS